jgi:hypothetical protein
LTKNINYIIEVLIMLHLGFFGNPLAGAPPLTEGSAISVRVRVRVRVKWNTC